MHSPRRIGAPDRHLDKERTKWHHRPAHWILPHRLGSPMNLKTFLTRMFSWWNDQTFGTQFWTSRHGEFVGEDEFGNRYYREKGGRISPALGYNRRWVIYNGVVEASRVPPAWHAWLHYIVDVPPTEDKVTPRPWWKPHRPNLTGLPGAYRPPGSTLAQNRRPPATGDYRAWTPNR
jgi:NADH:ubiquinone oxidoreductase subunit